MVESVFSAELSLDVEAGGGLQGRQRGDRSHCGCYCPSGGFIWRSGHGDTKSTVKLLNHL